VVLAINYQPEVMLNFLKDFETKLGIKITSRKRPSHLALLVLWLLLGTN